MPRNYTNSLDGVTPAFPGSTYTPIEFKDYDANGILVSNQSVTVPSVSPYVVTLGFQIQDQSQLVVKDALLVTYVKKGFDETISASEVGVDAKRGLLKFAAANATETLSVSYKHVGSVYLADFANIVQKEIVALEENVVQTASSTDHALARFDGTGGQLQDSVVTLSDLGVFDGAAGINHATQLDLSIANTAIATLTSVLAAFSTPIDVTGGGTFSGNLGAVDGSFSGDVDAVNLVLSGTATGFTNKTGTGNIVLDTSPTLVTPNIGAAIGTSLDVSSFVDAEDGFRVGGVTVIDDARELSVVTGEVTGALTVGLLSSGGAGSFAGNVTLSGLSRRINLSAWTGTAGQEGRIVFDTTEDGDTYMGEIATDHIGFTCGATLSAFISRFEFRPSVPVRAAYAGNATAPHYSFQADTNSGMFTSGADLLSFATGGVRAGGWDASQNFDVVGAQLTLGGIPIIRGAGDPEGSVTAPVASLYLRTDGSTSTTLYVKESGAGNTGWAAK